MCLNCWKIRCHNFACDWLCLHWTFIDIFLFAWGKLCKSMSWIKGWALYGVKEVPAMDTVTVLWCSALDLRPPVGAGPALWGRWRKERKCAQLFFLPELPGFVLFCSVFPCLQSHQILPSQQPYCLCALHEYYQENLQSCEVTCCTGPLHVKCLYVPPMYVSGILCLKKKSSQGCLYILYFFFSFIMNSIIISS